MADGCNNRVTEHPICINGKSLRLIVSYNKPIELRRLTYTSLSTAPRMYGSQAAMRAAVNPGEAAAAIGWQLHPYTSDRVLPMDDDVGPAIPEP